MRARVTAPVRLMFVDTWFAPCVGGSEVLMANLLSCYPGEVFAAVQKHPLVLEDPGFRSPCPVYRMWVPQRGLSWRIFSRLQQTPLIMLAYRRFLRGQIRRHRPKVIIAAASSWNMFASAFQVASQAGIPFYAHMHDLWEENCPPSSGSQSLARRWEPLILKRARRLLFMTTVQADFYREKYGIEGQLLPHTVLPAILAAAPHAMVSPRLPERTVLFVGTLSSQMNTDAMRVMAKAAEMLPGDVRCVILSRSSRTSWAAAGISSPRLLICSASREEVATHVSAAHILLAPLSHKNCSHHEVRTVLSTKLLEYLVSGRPILVFSPRNSFQAQSARQGGWGLVVDEDDPRALANGILNLLSDQALCARLVAGALLEARNRDARVHSRRLYDWVLEDSGVSATTNV